MSERLGVAVAKLNTRYPVALAPREARLFIFCIKCRRTRPEQRTIDTLERVDTDNGIGCSVDLAGDDRDDTALGADVELSRFRAEDIARDVGWIGDGNRKPTSRARSPHPSVFRAEGACAGTRWDRGWLGFPQQLE